MWQNRWNSELVEKWWNDEILKMLKCWNFQDSVYHPISTCALQSYLWFFHGWPQVTSSSMCYVFYVNPWLGISARARVHIPSHPISASRRWGDCKCPRASSFSLSRKSLSPVPKATSKGTYLFRAHSLISKHGVLLVHSNVMFGRSLWKAWNKDRSSLPEVHMNIITGFYHSF